ncbi:hypothetical protein [Halorussus salinisoli]|uniref:hypothetical protein n=1 Tax=Halorussus salinisoli TaxID=2558242 RepID=UPI0010C1C56A|nr:hypothetical protein [Halorussus salinisoli]
MDRSACPNELGSVCSGNWDQTCRRFQETRVYQSIYDRIVKDAAWDNTPLYDALLDLPKDAIWEREYKTEVEVDERLQHIDKIISKIKENGYYSQKQLLEKNPSHTKEMNNDAVHPRFNEIRVAIGRDGEMYMCRRGLHRLAIAKVLDIDEVAVLVAIRHHRWQRIRDNLRQNELSVSDKKWINHPDLAEFDGEDQKLP